MTFFKSHSIKKWFLITVNHRLPMTINPSSIRSFLNPWRQMNEVKWLRHNKENSNSRSGRHCLRYQQTTLSSSHRCAFHNCLIESVQRKQWNNYFLAEISRTNEKNRERQKPTKLWYESHFLIRMKHRHSAIANVDWIGVEDGRSAAILIACRPSSRYVESMENLSFETFSVRSSSLQTSSQTVVIAIGVQRLVLLLYDVIIHPVGYKDSRQLLKISLSSTFRIRHATAVTNAAPFPLPSWDILNVILASRGSSSRTFDSNNRLKLQWNPGVRRSKFNKNL